MRTDQTYEKMTECLDDIIDLRDDDTDTLETLDQSDDDDLDQVEDLHVDLSQDHLVQRKPLTKTEVEVETIQARLAMMLETEELEERSREADCLQDCRVNLPPSLDLLKHHLIGEFETVCQNEKALVFLLCGQTKHDLKNL